MIIDNQWTVKWCMLLPDNTHQFHVEHDFWFSSLRPVLVRAWQKIGFTSAVIFLIVAENYLDNYKIKT